MLVHWLEEDLLHRDFNTINRSKAVFEDIYVQDDPRAYFSTLGALDYMIPDVAEPVVRQILAAWSETEGRDPTVLDVGCSYGINAAVNRYPLSVSDLRHRYSRREIMGLTSPETMSLDRAYYAGWPVIGRSRFLGLDVSAPAVRYASEVGLIDQGVVANLESEPLAPDDARILGQADVILSTGAVGYVTEKTFAPLVDAAARPPWVISFVLRMFPFDALEAAFAERGMVTERLSGATFVQRRFRDAEEFEKTLAAVEARGLDTAGLEADGLLQAELFLSRPKADALRLPLNQVVTVASGRNRASSARYVMVETPAGTTVGMEA